ncbi:MAG: tRNA (adenosine(37)-N6)-threonylcarbamoyltransferase complex transferase subunit TsaD [Pseudopedobacter sp.]|nr:tRNA (adenosine(37)-N6)-threonylcarbamoyltransferase complex transferase subunit TsaD [Deinococcales bacterium]
MYILGIDTSCDDTGVGIVKLESGKATVVANALWTQEIHKQYGGVMPELASREHLEHMDRVLSVALGDADISLEQLGAIAATRGPGLMGALLVGLCYAKGLAQGLGVPFYAAHHLEGHIEAALSDYPDLPFPHLALVVSGGHTHLFDVQEPSLYKLIGATKDDAAGEAFDKVARLLGLGFPGGPAISRAALTGDPTRVPFGLPLEGQKGFDFSFSGLKTAALYAHRDGAELHDLAASFQAAVVRSLVKTCARAAKTLGREHLVVSGGVAANAALREAFSSLVLKTYFPPMDLTTDNGAMIALAGARAIKLGRESSALEVGAEAYLPLGA